MKKLCLLIAFLFVAASITACNSVKRVEISFLPAKHENMKSKRHGPPPHAPAHGYRHKHRHGTELVYDSSLGAYVVVNIIGVYYQNNLYMRLHDGHWEVSRKFNGPWRWARSREVPAKLKRIHVRKAPKKKTKVVVVTPKPEKEKVVVVTPKHKKKKVVVVTPKHKKKKVVVVSQKPKKAKVAVVSPKPKKTKVVVVSPKPKPVKHAKVKSKKHGPPPHAPAHGYRHKHQSGTELVFDSGLGAYAVVGVSGVYFQSNLYMRLLEGRWEVSGNFNGPWRKAKSREIPSKLKTAKGQGKPGKNLARKKR
jgi:hypothetical protein